MEFLDLKEQYRRLAPRLEERVRQVLAAGHYIMGPEVAELEQALQTYVGVPHAVTCANGTDALVLALKALEVGPGDLVVTSPFSFFATVEAIMLVGARPTFADIDPATFNMDPDALDRALAKARAAGTPAKAVIAVDLFGLPADYHRIEPICTAHGVALIEDAAQGFGGTQGGHRASAFGTIATTSFFPAKPLGCYGDGGALFTADDRLAELLRSLRVHGKGASKYDNVRIGTNSRLDTLQAAILLEKLALFDEELILRQQVADRYTALLPDIVKTPAAASGRTSSWAQYTVRCRSREERAALMRALGERGIPSAIYYERALHLQPALSGLGFAAGDFPCAEEASERVLSLPMGPYLSEQDQDRVIATVRQALIAA
jgi:dTDP-4-amino-4,6-dideoxygalactose transaminase